MEVRNNKYRQTSPDRAKIRSEPLPKQRRKVPVVYYLCRNRLLEQPHFIEVSVSSGEGLYLRDVINRLNVLRGKGMAGMYSWSCKRSYKNGFVWHDLCEDDLVFPANGNEYVLKGSELFDEPSSSGRHQHGKNVKLQQSPEKLPDAPSFRTQVASSSCSTGKGLLKPQEDDLPSPPCRLSSSGMSPDSFVGKSVGRNESWSSLSSAEYKVYKADPMSATDHGAADASTQTNERSRRTRQTCIRGVSTDDGLSEFESNQNQNQNKNHDQINLQSKEIELSREEISPPPSSSSASSGGKPETLESLIRADAKANSFRILEEEQVRSANTKLRPSNVLMQLISCGSFSVKDHSFGLVPTYKPRFSQVNQNPTAFAKFSPPLFSNSILLGELDYLSENPRLMGMRLEDKEYFSGSLIETKKQENEEGLPTLKRSSSYNADRSCKSFEPTQNSAKEADAARAKCIPRTIKCSNKKPSKNEVLRSPVAERHRNSSGGMDCPQSTSAFVSNGNSKRITGATEKKLSKRIEEEKEKIIKIEESFLLELGL